MITLDTLTDNQVKEVEKAISLVTIKDLQDLESGEQINLTENVCLYRYIEDDVITLNILEEWEEVYQVLFSAEAEEIIFEQL